MRMKGILVIGCAAVTLLLAIACEEQAAQVAPAPTITPVPTVTFAPGKTEADIINEAALCRLLVKGYSADEIRADLSLIERESRQVMHEYLDGEVGLTGLHKATQELCNR